MSPTTSESDFASDFPALANALQGHFRIERELGRGGMGAVYLARELKLDRLVALKVLPLSLATNHDTRERFLREARTAARLAHPNVVPVYRADEAGGTAYFAMAFVDGESLAERVRDRGPLAPAEAVAVLRAVAWALAYAHAHGVVHRDVKPENVLLERSTGRTMVTDFGIAHHSAIADESARLTQEGHVLGTLHYMSPEQLSGVPLDGRSDLYALGMVGYYVLSGRLPFEGLAVPAVLVAHATRPAPPLHEVAPTVPRTLCTVVDRCLAKRPEDRYANGEALAEALERALAEVPAAVRGLMPSFPPGLPERVDDAEASAIWRRAAQLQADALHRLEVREGFASRGRSPEEGDEGDATPGAGITGYRLADVAGAAVEAGISRQYVAMALAELPRGTRSAAPVASMGVSDRTATRVLGTDVRSLGVSVVIPAAPAATLRALGAVLQQAPYDLQLRETVGDHPLDGGVIVFDLPGVIVGVAAAASAVNFYWLGIHQQLESRQVQVTLRALPGSGPADAVRTEVTMTADLRPGVRRNVRASQWTAGIVGGGTGTFAAAVLAKGAAIVASAAVLGPAIAMGAVAAGLSLLAYRKLYPGVLRKAESEMRRALEAVGAAVQSEVVFGTLPGRGRTPRLNPVGETDGGTSFIVTVS